MEIDVLVKRAILGDKTALESVVIAIQDKVYSLALRMLVNNEDAKDATQEILVKVITNLSTFRNESQFTTWVFRIASNYLISDKKLKLKDPALSFDMFKKDLESDLKESKVVEDDADYQVLLNELRISCTMAMLLGLKPPLRMAYILGDIFDLDHNEASTVLSITPDNFRQQLSRARAKIVQFMSTSCGIVTRCAKCSCDKKLAGAINRKRVDAANIIFAGNSKYSYADVLTSLENTQRELKALTAQKTIQYHECPKTISASIVALVNEGLKLKKGMTWTTELN